MRALIMTVFSFLVAMPASGQNLLNGAESVDFDIDHNRYLVTSYYDGSVVAIDSHGVQSYYKTGFTRCYGLTVNQGVLYVSTGTEVKAFDLATDTQVFSHVFTPGIVQGVGCDGLGYLYAIDNLGRIIKMDLSNESMTVLTSSGLPGHPQDVAYDPVRHRLLAVGYANKSLVMQVDMATGEATPAAEFEIGVYDGICCDQHGNVYLSSGVLPGFLLKWDGEYSHAPTLVTAGHDEPAGNCVNERDSIIAVCNFAANSVDFISYADRDHDDRPAYNDNCPDTYNPGQDDADNDLIGDACDAGTDIDLDGYGGAGYPASTCETDNCPGVYNDDQSDRDGDGVGDVCDNCPDKPNPDQADGNGNQIGDACESCCRGRVGDANGQNGDEPTIGDINALISAIYTEQLPDAIAGCYIEADVNQSGGMNPVYPNDFTIADINLLIEYLYIKGPYDPDFNPGGAALNDCL